MSRSQRAYGRYMKRTFSTPLAEKFQSRRTRRLLVLAAIVNSAAVIALPLITGIDWLGLPFFLAFFPLAGLVNLSVRGVTEIPPSALDERQVQLRVFSMSAAYYPAVLLAFAAGAFAPWLLDTLPLPVAVGAGGIVGGTLMGLPALLLAWRLPDETAALDDEA